MSENIPYIIAEDGYYYVAYREKNPYIPYVTVSSKGIANGKSDIINDGADFGPDSYDPNAPVTAPPYSTSLGVQEMFNYAVANGDYGITSLEEITVNAALPMHFANGYYNLSEQTNVVLPPVPYGLDKGSMPQFTLLGDGSSLGANVILQHYNFTFGEAGQGQAPYGGFLIEGINFVACNIYFNAGMSANPMCNINRCGMGNTNVYFTGGSIAQLAFNESFFINDNFIVLVHGADQVSVFNGTFKGGLYISEVNQIGGVTLAEGIYIMAGNPIFNLNTWEIDDRLGNGIPIVNNTAGGTTSHAHFEVGTCILTAGTSSAYASFFANQLQSTLPNISGFNSTTQGNLDVSIHIGKLQLDAYTDFTVPSGITLKEFRIDSIINNSGQDISTLMALLTAATPSVPASGTAQQNTTPYPVNVYIYGGDVSEVQYTPDSGSAIEIGDTTPITVRLNRGDSITITYSTAPSWNWVRI